VKFSSLSDKADSKDTHGWNKKTDNTPYEKEMVLIVFVFKSIKGNVSLKKSQNQLSRPSLVEGCQILRIVSAIKVFVNCVTNNYLWAGDCGLRAGAGWSWKLNDGAEGTDMRFGSEGKGGRKEEDIGSVEKIKYSCQLVRCIQETVQCNTLPWQIWTLAEECRTNLSLSRVSKDKKHNSDHRSKSD